MTAAGERAMVDTAKVADRRRLRFADTGELLAEIDRVVAADQAGRLRCCGNWTAGQAMGHVATWINYGYEGYPRQVSPPWFIRIVLKYLRDGMPAGVRIPRIDAGTLGTEPLSTEEGAARLRRAVERLTREPARFPSPAFGAMSEHDRVQLNLRHAELHLGFLHPE